MDFVATGPSAPEATSATSAIGPFGMDHETVAFAVCLVTVFVDVMGQFLSLPVVVPFATSLGANTQMQATIVGLPFLGRLVGGVIMPILADRTSRKKVVWLSIFGSGFAYTLSTLSAMAGLSFLVAGRLLAGLFGNTLSMLLAYTTELYMPDMQKLKRKNSQLLAVNMGAPVLLAPLGGFLARIAMNAPFAVSASAALASLAFAVRYFRDVAEIKVALAGPRPLLTDDEAATRIQATARGNLTRQSVAPEAEMPSPWTDRILLLMALTYFFFGMGTSSTAVALPSLLAAEGSFGLSSGPDIARTIGFTQARTGIALTHARSKTPSALASTLSCVDILRTLRAHRCRMESR